jgi:hypothetical protein
VSPFVAAWARAFAATVAVELAVAAPLLGGRAPWSRRLAAVVLANLCSHPVVWLVIPELGLGWPAWIVVAELWAFAIEALLYGVVFAGQARRAVVASLAANAASLAVGLLLRAAGLPI